MEDSILHCHRFTCLHRKIDWDIKGRKTSTLLLDPNTRTCSVHEYLPRLSATWPVVLVNLRPTLPWESYKLSECRPFGRILRGGIQTKNANNMSFYQRAASLLLQSLGQKSSIRSYVPFKQAFCDLKRASPIQIFREHTITSPWN